jgi:hypothetical protein
MSTRNLPFIAVSAASVYLFTVFLTTCRSRDSSVDIATGYTLDNREFGVRVPVESRILSSPCRPDRLWDPPNLLFNGYQEVKRQGCEADHSPAASAEVDLYIHSPIRLHGVVLN